MTAKSKELSKARKKREISSTLASPEDVGKMDVGTRPRRATRPGEGHPRDPPPLEPATTVATGGADGSLALFDAAKGKRGALMTGHEKAVTDVAFAGDAVLTSSADKTVKIWRGGAEAAAVAGVHEGEVVAVRAHPTNAYAVSIGGDGAWAFVDVARRSASVQRDGEYTCGGFSRPTVSSWARAPPTRASRSGTSRRPRWPPRWRATSVR